MSDFFWFAFGVFFIVASLIGVVVVISFVLDFFWKRKSLKKWKEEQENKKDENTNK